MAQQMMQTCPMMQPSAGQPMTRVRSQEQQTP
jgi:hypothetical protein